MSEPTARYEEAGDGVHVAIIMDGNGRWANARGRPREWGHRQGAKRVKRIVEAAPDLGVRTLTLYAFSSDNWYRPRREVGLLMRLFARYLRTETEELRQNGVELRIVGRRDRLAAANAKRGLKKAAKPAAGKAAPAKAAAPAAKPAAKAAKK